MNRELRMGKVDLSFSNEKVDRYENNFSRVNIQAILTCKPVLALSWNFISMNHFQRSFHLFWAALSLNVIFSAQRKCIVAVFNNKKIKLLVLKQRKLLFKGRKLFKHDFWTGRRVS